jgi:hypothetical protein
MRGGPVSSNEPQPRAPAELGIDARRNRRTALVALRGELELVTVSKVAEVYRTSSPEAAAYVTSCWTCAV